MENHGEVWLPIKAHPNYEVSNTGRVRSIDRAYVDRLGRPYRKRGRTLRPRPAGGSASNRYLAVDLGQGGGTYIHRLVAAAFIGDIAPGLEVCHCNGVRSDNRADNLRLDTRAGNLADRRLHGTATYHHRKLNPDLAAEIRTRLMGGEAGAALAREYQVSETTISAIRKGRIWR